MKKNKELQLALVPLVITIGCYVVFYERIDSKPSDAGFWIILALGMAIGVAITQFFSWRKTKETDKQ
jgi:membrane protein CcdC involved in cytochrome C biogenesis